MPRPLAVFRSSSEHGRHIYAYCNDFTKQVLYSLERVLRNTHLKQLADVGANNNPPKLRKDVWRPLWTVSFPDSPDGQKQGLEAFRQLREYRMLHETNWELPPEITRPYTEKEIERMEKKLEDRGGSKKETVYDVIKRKKKNMRVNMVMNQKANSIADLAQILLRQEEQGVATAEKQEEAVRIRRQEDVRAMISLAKRSAAGEVEDLKGKIPMLEAEIKEAEQAAGNKELKSKERRAGFQKALHTRKDLEKVHLTLRRMEWSAIQVAEAKAKAADAQKVADASQAQEREAQAKVKAAAPSPAAESQAPQQGTTSQSGTGYEPMASQDQDGLESPSVVNFRDFLPEFPAELDSVAAAKAELPLSKHSALQPAKYEEKKLVKLVKQPIFTANNIVVKWANILDAEFAQTWPEGVSHGRLGFVRNTAPKPDDEPMDDIKRFRGLIPPDPEEVAREEEAKSRRSAVIKSIGDRIIGRVTRKRPQALESLVEESKQQKSTETDQLESESNATQQEASEPPVQSDAPRL